MWTTWSDWSECSSTCNGGARNRSRDCIEPMFGGAYCPGHDAELDVCGMELCPGGLLFVSVPVEVRSRTIAGIDAKFEVSLGVIKFASFPHFQ